MAEFDGWWDKILPFWNLLYLGLLTLAMLTTAMSGAHSSGERWGIIALLAVMAVTYVGLGRRLFEAPGGLPAAAYFFVTWSCFYAIILVADRNTSAYFVLFAMFPQIWAFLAARPAAYTSVIVIAGEAITEMQVAGWGWSTAARQLPISVMQAGLVLLLGLLMVGVIRQAERRAVLIDELEATRSELAETERARGVLEERERLAHEIHDTLAQGFTSILALSQATEAAIERRPDAARERLALLERTARENLAEARALVHALAPADLQEASLPDAIRRIAGRFTEEAGVASEMEVDVVPELVPRLQVSGEIVLLRSVQEALANVRKHAEATSVRVALSFVAGEKGMASVTVVDDGKGFDPRRVNEANGFGLRGMRARAQEVGGGLEVVSSSGCGTTVRVHVPI